MLCFGLGVEPKVRVQRALPEDLLDLRVLVVDDNPTARTILARYLESFGFSTGEVASGAEALERWNGLRQVVTLPTLD